MNNQAKTGEIVRLEINHGTTGQVQCKAIRRNGPNRRPSRPVVLIVVEHVMVNAPLPPKNQVFRDQRAAAKHLGCSPGTVWTACDQKLHKYGYRIRWASHAQAMRLEHAISTPDATPTPQDHQPAYIPPTQATWVGVLRTAKESTAEADRLKVQHTENLDEVERLCSIADQNRKEFTAQVATLEKLLADHREESRQKRAEWTTEVQHLNQAIVASEQECQRLSDELECAPVGPGVCLVSLEALSAVSRLLAELATHIAASVVRDALEGHLSKLLGDMGLRLEQENIEPLAQEEPCT